ncbi:MAG: glycine zipper domain-containing protein [Deltaproteobacteria bacterium]|jgi:surface antigen
MPRKITMLFAIVSLFFMVSCQTDQFGKKETGAAVGAAGGAILGQAIGRSTGATLLGGAIGGVLGYIVGSQMEKSDRVNLNQTLESTPSYETKKWTNPDTGAQYEVTPKPAYQAPETGKVCRKVDILSDINGQTEKTEATACREDGRWVLQ